MLNKKLQKLINTNSNIMLSGQAGVGKSFQVKRIIEKYGKDKKIALTSTTGIAATNINGQTLHSFLNLGMIRTEDAKKEIARIVYNPYARWAHVIKTDILIIDEISMCDGFLFSIVEEVLREVRRSSEPFGGVQVILVGDCYQLPPVESNKKGFFFESEAYAFGNFKPMLLTKVYRQNDKKFIDCLNRVRLAKHTDKDITYLKKREFPDQNYALLDTTCLFPTNKEADILNAYRLDEIEAEEVVIESKDTDYTNPTLTGTKRDFNKNLRAQKLLKLKKGARVILLNNYSVERGLCNGSTGYFEKKKGDLLVCKFNNEEVMLPKAKFEIHEKSKLVFEREQYPLALGWGISIHKSQGMSLDSVAINFDKIFAPHQAYVALSRARSYDGLYLKCLSSDKVFIDYKVVDFMKKLEDI